MRATLGLLVLLAGCAREAPRAPVKPPPPPPPRPAPVLEGALGGKPFAPKKVLVYRSLGVSYVYFSASAASPRCQREQSVTEYVQLTSPEPFPTPGSVASEGSAAMVFSSPSPKAGGTFRLSIDAVEKGSVKGTIDWKVSPEFFLRGPFEAADCPTRAVLRDARIPVNGVAWQASPLPVSSIPGAPAAGFLAGAPFDPVEVELIGFESSPADKYDFPLLRFHSEKKAKRCERYGLAHGFEFPLQTPLAAHPTKDVAMAGAKGYFAEVGDVRGTIEKGGATIVIDSIDRKAGTAHGKIYASFDDPSKSLLAGSFTARYCADPAK